MFDRYWHARPGPSPHGTGLGFAIVRGRRWFTLPRVIWLAPRVLRAAPKELDPAVFVAYLGTYWDLAWVLDEEQRRLLVRLPDRFHVALAGRYVLERELGRGGMAAVHQRPRIHLQYQSPGTFRPLPAHRRDKLASAGGGVQVSAMSEPGRPPPPPIPFSVTLGDRAFSGTYTVMCGVASNVPTAGRLRFGTLG